MMASFDSQKPRAKKRGPAEAGPSFLLILLVLSRLVVALIGFLRFRGRRAIALIARARLSGRGAAARWAALTGCLALRRSLSALVLLSGWCPAFALARGLVLSRLVRLSSRALLS